jgi:hypothetical protein
MCIMQEQRKRPAYVVEISTHADVRGDLAKLDS